MNMSIIDDLDPDNMNEVVAAVKELRDDFDRLMDVVQRYSAFQGTPLRN